MDIILVPGLWLDGSSWGDVAPILEQAGHRPHALTLPAMEPKDEDRSGITLPRSTHDPTGSPASSPWTAAPSRGRGHQRQAARRER